MTITGKRTNKARDTFITRSNKRSKLICIIDGQYHINCISLNSSLSNSNVLLQDPDNKSFTRVDVTTDAFRLVDSTVVSEDEATKKKESQINDKC